MVDVSAINHLAANYEGAMVALLRDLVRIPSESAGEKGVIERLQQELEQTGAYDKIWIDGLGNLLAQIGTGPRLIAIDAHVDTVGLGNRDEWAHDPYEGKIADGMVWGRGAGLVDPESAPHEGSILRGMTEQDRLLETRIAKNRREAYDACSTKLAELGLDAPLLDVEHLFDGGSLIFYFLGDPPADAARVTDELAEAYDAQVQFRAFSDAVVAGCGPDCGTEKAGGCGECGTGCAIAAACSTHKH